MAALPGHPASNSSVDALTIEARAVDISSDAMRKNLAQIPLAQQPGTTWE